MKPKDQTSPRDTVERTFGPAVAVIGLRQDLDDTRGVGRVMMSPILRAGTSVPANVEEAQPGRSRLDFSSKMTIAAREASETHLRSRILATSSVLDEGRLLPTIREAGEIKRIPGAIVVSTKRPGPVWII